MRTQKNRPLPMGSPPRMRGKLGCPRVSGKHQRITPADAGKTVLIALFTVARSDHPRGCGENHF